MVSEIVCGGQVEKKPAADVTSEVVALITVEPGRSRGNAVWIRAGGAARSRACRIRRIVDGHTLAVTGLYVIVPTFALGWCRKAWWGCKSVVPPGPVTVVSASSDVVSV